MATGEETDVKVNLGCGRSPIDGWVNVDGITQPGVDVVADLDYHPYVEPGELVELLHGQGVVDVTRWHLSHLVEHLHRPLFLFEVMWELSAEDAVAVVRCPYGSSDDAFDDPTHVRHIFHGFWPYLGQPYYWRADYGYRGDWSVDSVQLLITDQRLAGYSDDDLWTMVQRGRNVVAEQFVTLRAVKPQRQPLLVNQEPLNVRLVRDGRDSYAWPSGYKEVMA